MFVPAVLAEGDSDGNVESTAQLLTLNKKSYHSLIIYQGSQLNISLLTLVAMCLFTHMTVGQAVSVRRYLTGFWQGQLCPWDRLLPSRCPAMWQPRELRG